MMYYNMSKYSFILYSLLCFLCGECAHVYWSPYPADDSCSDVALAQALQQILFIYISILTLDTAQANWLFVGKVLV